jgi:hypothetical protein
MGNFTSSEKECPKCDICKPCAKPKPCPQCPVPPPCPDCPDCPECPPKFDDNDFDQGLVAVLRSLNPAESDYAVVGILQGLSYNFTEGQIFNGPSNWAGLMFYGYFKPSENGSYQFRVRVDDGLTLAIDGRVIASRSTQNGDWDRQNYDENSNRFQFKKGEYYPLVGEFTEATGFAYFEVQCKVNGGSYRPVRTNELFHKRVSGQSQQVFY